MLTIRRTIPLLLVALLVSLGIGPRNAGAAERRATVDIFVDTDIGVDDAVAIAWLLQNRSANILGFTTVSGNTTAENAAKNLLTLFDAAHRQLPITVGSAGPLVLPASHIGAFTHGPSGLWFSQVPHAISGLPNDAPAAIAAAAHAHPGMTLLTLGPLTNVAQAAQRFPADMAGVHVVALAGSRGPGNTTPVSEFNAYYDPHALDITLNSGLDV